MCNECGWHEAMDIYDELYLLEGNEYAIDRVELLRKKKHIGRRLMKRLRTIATNLDMWNVECEPEKVQENASVGPPLDNDKWKFVPVDEPHGIKTDGSGSGTFYMHTYHTKYDHVAMLKAAHMAQSAPPQLDKSQQFVQDYALRLIAEGKSVSKYLIVPEFQPAFVPAAANPDSQGIGFAFQREFEVLNMYKVAGAGKKKIWLKDRKTGYTWYVATVAVEDDNV